MEKRQNALWNCRNPHQGNRERVLCVCSAGLLRSPTVAGELYLRGYNTRAAGVHDYALVQVDDVLLEWADTILFVHPSLEDVIKVPDEVRIVVLNIPDNYGFRDDELVKIVNAQLDQAGMVKAA